MPSCRLWSTVLLINFKLSAVAQPDEHIQDTGMLQRKNVGVIISECCLLSSFHAMVSVSLENWDISFALQRHDLSVHTSVCSMPKGHISTQPFLGHKGAAPPSNLSLTVVLCLPSSVHGHLVCPLEWAC